MEIACSSKLECAYIAPSRVMRMLPGKLLTDLNEVYHTGWQGLSRSQVFREVMMGIRKEGIFFEDVIIVMSTFEFRAIVKSVKVEMCHTG